MKISKSEKWFIIRWDDWIIQCWTIAERTVAELMALFFAENIELYKEFSLENSEIINSKICEYYEKYLSKKSEKVEFLNFSESEFKNEKYFKLLFFWIYSNILILFILFIVILIK